MKQILFLLLLTFSISNLHAQHSRDVEDFSDKYTAKVYYKDVEGGSDGFPYPIEIKVYEKLTGKEIIKVVSEFYSSENEFAKLDEDEKIKANKAESIIIAGDFNCDGHEDLAIQTSYYWNYPSSYAIYLHKDGALTEDEEWTNLIENCSMFTYNCETKTLETFCYVRHQSETEFHYFIENGSPILMEEITTVYAGTNLPYDDITKWTPNGYEQTTTIAEDYMDIVFRLKLADIDREIIFFDALDNLFYCVIDSKGVIDEGLMGKQDGLGEFKLTRTGEIYNLCFELDTPKFEIIWTDSEINVHTFGENKEHIYKGIHPKEGISVDKIFNAQFENLIKQN